MVVVKRLSKKKIKMIPDEGLHIIGLWNLMVILIPFLLLSAVASQTTILNLYIPTGSSEAPTGPSEQTPFIVSITLDGFKIQAGENFLFSLPKKNGQYDLEGLSSTLYSLKKDFLNQNHLILLSDSEVSYDILVRVMDASRERVVIENGVIQSFPLFPMVSIGEGSE